MCVIKTFSKWPFEILKTINSDGRFYQLLISNDPEISGAEVYVHSQHAGLLLGFDINDAEHAIKLIHKHAPEKFDACSISIITPDFYGDLKPATLYTLSGVVKLAAYLSAFQSLKPGSETK